MTLILAQRGRDVSGRTAQAATRRPRASCRLRGGGSAMPRRLHYIDWLRVLAVLLLFPFHVSRVFNAGEPFYIKGPELSEALNLTLGFINQWHMPLLFLLAGASTYLAF